jgi:murein DD-endopeptidase MepM/ murein hydrolase activator NlpD
MPGLIRRLLLLALALGCPAFAAGPSITASPGSLVRWSLPGTQHCAMKGRAWAALHETCFYPVDLLQKPTVISIARWGAGPRQYASISVEPFDYGTEEIELPDIPQANPSPEDLKRVSREQLQEAKVWARKEGLAKFTLPLGPPSRPFPKGQSFGVNRVFNGKPAPQPHTGVDYPTPVGSPVLAVADGTVVMAADLFFPGNAVFIDHGDGLVSMYFHLAEINVKAGEDVKKGHTLGKIGSTGRATGPHLFFGVRWHGARIDPSFLFEDPAKIPDVQSASPQVRSSAKPGIQ